jgi:hypothetical protein
VNSQWHLPKENAIKEKTTKQSLRLKKLLPSLSTVATVCCPITQSL